ncbi:MAG: hypothetical protein FD163_1719 [Hyphomonadaceae bacterium]|nr:MAG: hypothetical protein FD128_2701 [Hyphomonadaceae bacterium]KAF0185022.1 MAG: hypothetical protein FD163_1719 [Hyphomonadaceae bacterium]
MTTFAQWDIVVVPFPYTDRTTTKRRPALVVSNDELRENHGLVWVVMITSAKNAKWDGDIEIKDFEAVGLPAPSIIRPCKITTIDAGLVLGKLGGISITDCAIVTKQVSRILAA